MHFILCAELICSNRNKYFNFVQYISPTWNGTGSWNDPSYTPWTYLLYTINTTAADDLATQGARPSAAMILTKTNIPDLAPQGSTVTDKTFIKAIPVGYIWIWDFFLTNRSIISYIIPIFFLTNPSINFVYYHNQNRWPSFLAHLAVSRDLCITLSYQHSLCLTYVNYGK